MKIDGQPFFSEAKMEQLARECALVERKSPITGFKFLLTFTTGLLNTPNGTLAQRTAFLSSVCQIEVSPQALDERMSVAAVAFMRGCLEKALAMAKRPREFDRGVLAEFDPVYIIDSTNFDLHPSLREVFKGSSGSASKAAMRIQLVLDYLTGQLYVEIGDTKLCDAPTLQRLVESHALNIGGQCLFLSDLGYFKIATFGNIKKNDRFLQYALFLTNLPQTYGIDTLFTLYRIRWQIELVFKTWKSILALHKIRSAKGERVLCEVYGKPILAALSSTITAEAETKRDLIVVSLHKAMQHLRTVAMPWSFAIMQGGSALVAFIAKQTLEIARLCKKHRQTNKPTIEFRLKQTRAKKTNVPTQDDHFALA